MPLRPFTASKYRCLSLLLLAATLSAIGCGGDTPASNDAPRVERGAPIAAMEVQPRDLSRSLSLSATVEPRVVIRLASRTSGTIDRITVEAGDRVRQGDLLLALDLSEHQAELARAGAEEEEATLDYRRARELRSSGVVSDADYQRARVALHISRSQRELWETRVAYGRVTAPLDAVVTARHVEPGEAVEAQDTLFELAALDELVMRPGVSEMDVIHLSVGQTLPIRLDALPERVLEGRIRRIFPMADAASRLVTVEVALPASASTGGVRPGFLGRIQTPIDPRPEALAVPAAAIGEDSEGRYLYVIEEEHLVRRTVDIGVTRGPWTEILKGLTPGDIILATNPIDMREGQRVRIVGWRG
ncbi:efflux RND transporter periplasmic adaptor subunit [Ectothiorhodospira lacustris]|uniref:efflux RND transporter periplasmic adaptor subunit n=1 Tax=Ectothiorhodospira lacustris TaxID=2899127 RepID=UPI001EE83C6B|nr:efflux RND transporter periplasmic adaptor subunit [Ectothiorhodospira lacustris]MCG5500288.1 efflux RND transporter periplasmic adaptor subunit [Ectothiorhodospira lacustris]MCG5511145.1 efflux RND transporter periplasmic adaptor subunit [Ectothiorhodospira lacustris]MCG5522809.1 efflux RND transporter periplasmic adaptor subunit [Ectothiorhodospira lacustris]